MFHSPICVKVVNVSGDIMVDVVLRPRHKVYSKPTTISDPFLKEENRSFFATQATLNNSLNGTKQSTNWEHGAYNELFMLSHIRTL